MRRLAPLAVIVLALALAGCEQAGGHTAKVLYAGSLTNLMEQGVGPAFQHAKGDAYLGQGAGSVALANAIKDQTKSGDVFISADPAVNATLGDHWAGWYAVFARTSMVIGYSPKSSFAADFAKTPWYQVLEQPGLRLGRTDPALDPKGYRTILMFELAQDYYHRPNLDRAVLASAPVFPEETLVTRLETGALDAGIFYLNEAVEKKLPYVTLPDEINLSNPAMAGQYAKASWTSPKGQTITGSPILYTVTILNHAKDPAAGQAFVQYLLSSPAKSIMMDHGLLSSSILYGGDKSKVPAGIQPLVGGEYKPA